jgi:hypothetical protein
VPQAGHRERVVARTRTQVEDPHAGPDAGRLQQHRGGRREQPALLVQPVELGRIVAELVLALAHRTPLPGSPVFGKPCVQAGLCSRSPVLPASMALTLRLYHPFTITGRAGRGG